MSVTLKKVFLSDTGAGKTQSDQHHKLQTSAIAYSYTRPNGYQVTVFKPIIDALTFTVPIPKQLEVLLEKRLGQLASGSGGLADKVSIAAKAEKKGSTKYQRSYEVAYEQSKVLLQIKPNSETSNFLRVEINPWRLTSSEINGVWEVLSGISEGHLSKMVVAEAAKVTRIDIAIDMLNIDPEDILVSHTFAGKTNAYFGGNGKIETIYFDKKTKASTTYLYDKKIQMKETGKPTHAGPNDYGDAKYTRLERRVQTQKPIKNLVSLKNPLKQLDLLDMDGCETPGEPHVWRLFQDACRYRGLVAALELLPAKEREDFQKVIEKSSGLLWRPDNIWSFWKNSLASSGLLFVE